MTDLLELPFDQYQRYQLVRELVESVRGPRERFRVLDVGGRTALLRRFLPDDRVELVDVDPSDAEGLVLGSGAQLPFADGVFDVVAAFDTLEHVPPALREPFVAECARVSRRYVMLAGPYDSPRVAEAEEILLQFLRDRLDWEHRYLAEHRTNGLPDAAATITGFERAGARVETFGHAALDRWLLLMSLELYIEHEGLLHDVAKRIYRFYNEHLFRTDHGGEVYRHAIVAAFDGAPMPSLEAALDPPGSAPAEATQALVDAGREMLRYDALQTTYRPELDRMRGEVERAVADRKGFEETLATTRADLEQHKKTIAALRDDLEREREAARSITAAKDAEIASLTEARNGIAADLEGHKGTLAELERLRAGELSELELRATRMEELGEQIGGLNGEIAERDGTIERAVLRLLPVFGEVPAPESANGQDPGTADVNLDELGDRIVEEINSLRDQLRRVRANHRELVAEAHRPFAKMGRSLTFRKFDPAWLDDGTGNAVPIE